MKTTSRLVPAVHEVHDYMVTTSVFCSTECTEDFLSQFNANYAEENVWTEPEPINYHTLCENCREEI